jgi:hypothetical protein
MQQNFDLDSCFNFESLKFLVGKLKSPLIEKGNFLIDILWSTRQGKPGQAKPSQAKLTFFRESQWFSCVQIILQQLVLDLRHFWVGLYQNNDLSGFLIPTFFCGRY